MARWLFLLCAVAAVGLLGWAGCLALFPVPERPVFLAADPDRDLGELPVGKSDLTFNITNQSGEPGRIIGLAQG